MPENQENNNELNNHDINYNQSSSFPNPTLLNPDNSNIDNYLLEENTSSNYLPLFQAIIIIIIGSCLLYLILKYTLNKGLNYLLIDLIYQKQFNSPPLGILYPYQVIFILKNFITQFIIIISFNLSLFIFYYFKNIKKEDKHKLFIIIMIFIAFAISYIMYKNITTLNKYIEIFKNTKSSFGTESLIKKELLSLNILRIITIISYIITFLFIYIYYKKSIANNNPKANFKNAQKYDII